MMLALAAASMTPAGSVAPAVASSRSAVIPVTTTQDELNADGDCSLREAIVASNSDTRVDACGAGSGADTITLPAGRFRLTIRGQSEDAAATGDLDITGDLRIRGVSAAETIVDARWHDRIFDLWGTPSVVLEDLAAVHGSTIEDVPEPIGHPSQPGGAIRNTQGDLRITRSLITGDTHIVRGFGCATDGGTSGPGGAVYHGTGRLTVRDSRVLGESCAQGGAIHNASGTLVVERSRLGGMALAGGGAIFNGGDGSASTVFSNSVIGRAQSYGGGGAIFNAQGSVIISRSRLKGNVSIRSTGRSPQGLYGGAVHNLGTMRITESSLLENDAMSGGGIWNAGTLTVIRSAVVGNRAISTDSEIGAAGIANDGEMTLRNVTVSGNLAEPYPQAVGGVGNYAGTITILSSTVVDNAVRETIEGRGVGGIRVAGGTTMVGNSIIANNVAFVPSDCSGSLELSGHVLLEHVNGCTTTGDSTGFVTDVDPVLARLALNGGRTQNHMPQPGSPAIDGGPETISATCIADDQRMVARPIDGDGDDYPRCDLGAVEAPAS